MGFLGRFVVGSVLGGLVFGGLTVGLFRLLAPGDGWSTTLAASAAGWSASTIGWSVVAVGFCRAPERALLWYGLGLMAKVVVIALSGVLLLAVMGRTVSQCVMPFAAVFFTVGFLQLALVVKVAEGLGGTRTVGAAGDRSAAMRME